MFLVYEGGGWCVCVTLGGYTCCHHPLLFHPLVDTNDGYIMHSINFSIFNPNLYYKPLQ